MATPSNSPLLSSMHCMGNFVLEFPSINLPILTLTHARAKLVISSTDLARMRHRENRRDREFMLGNSRMKLHDAMHAGQERWVWRGRGLAASAAPVDWTMAHSQRRMQNTGGEPSRTKMHRSTMRNWIESAACSISFNNTRKELVAFVNCRINIKNQLAPSHRQQ